jgi:hypothetical protein
MYEPFCTAREELDTHFVFRTCVDRLAGDGEHTIEDGMQEVECKGRHRIEVRVKKDDAREAVLELKVSAYSSCASHRETKALFSIGADCPSREGTRCASRIRTDRREADYRCRSHRGTELVRAPLED